VEADDRESTAGAEDTLAGDKIWAAGPPPEGDNGQAGEDDEAMAAVADLDQLCLLTMNINKEVSSLFSARSAFVFRRPLQIWKRRALIG